MRGGRNLATVGVEWNAAAAARAAAKSGAPVVRGGVGALPFASGAFAGVVSSDVLCHGAVEPAAALAEFARVLAPGGRLVVNMPAYQWLLSTHDRRVENVRRVTAAGLRSWLAAAGFEAIRTRHWNSLLLPLMVVERKLLARGAAAASDVAPFSPWVDAMFHAATVIERPLRLPFGGSVLAVAEKPGAARP